MLPHLRIIFGCTWYLQIYITDMFQLILEIQKILIDSHYKNSIRNFFEKSQMTESIGVPVGFLMILCKG